MLKKSLCLLVFAITLPANFMSGQTLATAVQNVAEVTVTKNVIMKTRDGVSLHADIYRPTADGKYPVLLTRTPYNKDNVAAFGQKGAVRGYIVVVQDVRGRYTSEGEWYTFKHEIEDGYDTVEWAAALPNSNGKVGMFGGSYVGATQMLAAIGHPPHLAGICPVVTASNYHENWTYQGGAFEQWFNESWTSGLAQDTYSRWINKQANAVIGDTVLPLKNFPVFNITNPQDGAALTHSLAPYFIDWLDHPTYDSYWKQWSIEENYQNIQVPALTIAAWYDIFQGGSLRNYLGMKAHAGSDAARNGQHLMVAIGGHSGGGRTVGQVDFGPDAHFERMPSSSIGTTTCSWVSRMSLPTASQSKSSSWARTSGVMRTPGRWSGPRSPASLCTQTGRQTLYQATESCCPEPGFRTTTHPTASSTTPPTPPPRSAARCAATPFILLPARATRRSSRRAPTCLSTPHHPSNKTWKLPVL